MKVLGWLRGTSAILCLLSLVLLLTSGWALMAGYVPSDAEAFSSVLFARQQVPGGSGVRSVHYFLSMSLVVTGFLYLLVTYLLGKQTVDKSRWWLALTLYFLVLGMCFTGYLLPMDQNAYWGTVVRLGIMETVPVIGSDLAQMLRGGQVFNASTLPRFYALHVAVLPIFCGLLLAPLLRKVSARLGQSGPWVAWAIAGVGALALLYLLAASNMAPLELRADPTDTEYVPRPEWYFLWLFQFGKYVESVPWVESLVVPMAGLTFLFALPLMTRQGFGARCAVALAWVVVWVTLTGLAIHQDRDLEPKLPYELAMEMRANDVYKDLCLECHGAEGRGDGARSLRFDLEARDFTQPEVWQEVSETEMIRSTRDGKGKDMPGFGRQLNHEETVAVLSFMKTNFAPADTSRSND